MTKEEAIKVVYGIPVTKEQHEALQFLIPELVESEDERIINELIQFFQFLKNWTGDNKFMAYSPYEISKWSDWLEKQKEPHKRLRDKTPWIVTAKEELAHDEECLQVNLEELRRIRAEKEKQKEQKPVEKQGQISREDILHQLVQNGSITMFDYLYLTKEQKPAEWSEEDDKMLADTIFKLAGFMGNEKNIAWLKSLRPQPQGTYKLIVHNIYEMLKDKDFFDIPPSHRVSLLNDIRVRCKNADEQAEILDVPSWNPSEELLDALHTAAYLPEMEFYGGLKDKLRELDKQLKGHRI